MRRFYLGTHKPVWLERASVPLFVSRRSLHGRATFPRAVVPWALDSGGFTEIDQHGGWSIDAAEYDRQVRRIVDEVGAPDFVAPQDWMVEPHMVARTGLTVLEHQRRTVANYVELRTLGTPRVIPVLQGWTLDDYLACIDLYAEAGVDLGAVDRVGLGSVCRRQSTGEIERIVRRLQAEGIALHGFGVKTSGLARYRFALASADSLGWSYHARREGNARRARGLPGALVEGCTHAACNNCMVWAERWYRQVLAASENEQLVLAGT